MELSAGCKETGDLGILKNWAVDNGEFHGESMTALTLFSTGAKHQDFIKINQACEPEIENLCQGMCLGRKR